MGGFDPLDPDPKVTISRDPDLIWDVGYRSNGRGKLGTQVAAIARRRRPSRRRLAGGHAIRRSCVWFGTGSGRGDRGAYGELFRREKSRPTWPWRPGGGEQRLGAPASPCGCGCRWCRAPGPKAREGPGRPVQRRERVGRWLTEAGVDRTRGETRPAASSVENQPLRGRSQGRRPRIGSWCSDEAPAGSGRS
jgi:hypothetical protein